MKVIKLTEEERTKLAVLEGLVRANHEAFMRRQEFVKSLREKYFPVELRRLNSAFHVDESGQYLTVE